MMTQPVSTSTRGVNGLKSDEFLPFILKDVEACSRNHPQIKIESVRTVSKSIRQLLELDFQENQYDELNSVMKRWIDLLQNFRNSQKGKTDNTEYSLMSDNEITDCDYKEIVRLSYKSFEDFATKKKLLIDANHPIQNSLILFKKVFDIEKKIENKRLNELRTRRITATKTVLFESMELPLSNELKKLIEPLLPSKQEEDVKTMILQDITNLVHTISDKARCDVFGSSASGLGFCHSDFDVALYAKDFSLEGLQKVVTVDHLSEDNSFKNENEGLSSEEFLKKLKIESLIVLKVAEVVRKSGKFENVETISTARIPLIKMIHKDSKIQCDLAVGNELAVHNTRLLKAYSELSPIAKQLILCIKLWAKKRGVGDAANGFISSYGWTLLVLYYLQHTPERYGGQVLPNLQVIQPYEVDCIINNFKVQYSVKNLNQVTEEDAGKKHELGNVFLGFFSFYCGEFSYISDCVSFGVKPKKKANDTPRWRFSIIDPFELTHDLGTTLSGRRAQIVINEELWRGFSLISQKKEGEELSGLLENLFNDENVVRLGGRICMHCGDSGHWSKTCTTFAVSDNVVSRNSMIGPCFKCGEYGHISRMCTKKPVNRGGMKKGGPIKSLPPSSQQQQRQQKQPMNLGSNSRRPFENSAPKSKLSTPLPHQQQQNKSFAIGQPKRTPPLPPPTSSQKRGIHTTPLKSNEVQNPTSTVSAPVSNQVMSAKKLPFSKQQQQIQQKDQKPSITKDGKQPQGERKPVKPQLKQNTTPIVQREDMKTVQPQQPSDKLNQVKKPTSQPRKQTRTPQEEAEAAHRLSFQEIQQKTLERKTALEKERSPRVTKEESPPIPQFSLPPLSVQVKKEQDSSPSAPPQFSLPPPS